MKYDKEYYLLTVWSHDLVFEFFEEKHASRKDAMAALEEHRKKYNIHKAIVRKCEDVYRSVKETRKLTLDSLSE